MWCTQGDDLRTFLGDFAASLAQIDFPITALMLTTEALAADLREDEDKSAVAGGHGGMGGGGMY
jgi:hypothetical protein